MRSSRLGRYFAAVLLGSLLGLTPGSAQIAQVRELVSRLDKELKPLKPRMVAVVDFRSPNSAKVQAHYLAWLVSNTLEVAAKKKLAVADHRAFDSDLAALHLTPEALIPGDPLRAAARSIGANLLVIGTLDKRDSSYFLEITPVRVLDSQTFA